MLETSDEFQTAEGLRNGLTIHLWRQPRGGPLLIYLTGIFQGAEDADTSRVVATMLEAGYQVAVLPNPLGREYMANLPTSPPNSSAREARIIREAIAELWSREGGDFVRVIGASHGAGLAARVYAEDQASTSPLVRDFTLLFPQRDIGASMKLVDSHIAASKWREGARATIGMAYQTSLRKFVKRRLRMFLGDHAAGFRARSYSPTAVAHLSRYSSRAFGRRLTLAKVIEDYIAEPEVSATYDGQNDSLVYWLEKAHSVRGDDNVRLLTAVDDWTNWPGAWKDLPQWLGDSKRMIVLERAGHAGVVAQEWFRQIILIGMRFQ